MDDVKTFVYETVAKSFGISVAEINDQLKLLADLDAKSTNYFPIINDLDDEYDLDLQYQEFRSRCNTVGDIVKLVEEEI
ncbi:MAG: acyl carrier protein [Liquorilactobacillus nagelii]|mgnify:CR=1 FL=1|jgi:acyl carrier protein|uniref:acyl carrier protein n=1 Tax=Liquorilactobacillus nagelii TaxID=82688 RepID=UPI00242A497E|nr:acyl carrier protein [Liquorilactobacillus nagelii]MCI1632698.1 acyl carrier protein [Liquorilactobacillus nagelii]